MSSYETLRQRYVHAYRQRLPAETARLTWSRRQLWDLRDERLRYLLELARESSPWHARRLEGLDSNQISGDDLSAIPPMTKDDLMTHWDEIVTDRRLCLELANAHLAQIGAQEEPALLFDRYHIVASGGSSGRRAVMAWDFDGFLAHRMAYGRASLLRSRLVPVRDTEGAPVLAMVYATSPVHISAALARCFETGRFRHATFSATRPVAELLAALGELRPTHLTTYPSLLQVFAQAAKRGELELPLRRITTTGEPLWPEIRELAREVWPVSIDDTWGTTESAPIAASDGVEPSLVVNEDLNVIEPVDDDYRPVPPGERASKVLVTNLVNRVLPVIRYEVPDAVSFLPDPPGTDPEAPGPWRGRRIAAVEGRRDDLFTYPGGQTLHPFAVRDVLGTVAAIDEYQVRQTPGGLEVLLRAHGAWDRGHVEGRLRQILAELGLEEGDLEVRAVESLDRHPETGKLLRFVPLGGIA